MSAPDQPMTTLIVEDDPGDQILIQEAFADHVADSTPRLIVLEDGQQALDFLGRRGAYTDAPRPDLVLLDLNLPTTSPPYTYCAPTSTSPNPSTSTPSPPPSNKGFFIHTARLPRPSAA